ncbi:MAG: hypothetical protein KGN02_01805 [bacterium]|nr:hypothetical protein [bacterium]
MLSVALPEIRERFRDPNFLLTICAVAAATTLLAPGPGDSYATLAVDLGKRTLLFASNPGFDGTAAGVAFAAFAPLVGLFGLSGGFSRDERTRFAETLRALPVSNLHLVLGRVLAAWVLACAFTLAACALLGITLAFRYHGAYDVARYAENFFLLALPSMLFTASAACILDLLLGNRRGLYVTAAILLWFTVITASAGHLVDPTGVASVEREARVGIGMPHAGIDIGATWDEATGGILQWNGLAPLAITVAQRLQTIGIAALLALVPLFVFRRRPNRSFAAPGDAEPLLTRNAAPLAPAPRSRTPGIAGRVATEVRLRIATHRWIAVFTALVATVALFIPASAERFAIAATMLLPALWMRAFDDTARSSALDGLLASLPGGIARDTYAKLCATLLLSAAPALAIPLRHPTDVAMWSVVLSAVALESAWLALTMTTLRAEMLGLGVLGIAWYIVGFNATPPPLDYMGATHPVLATTIANATLAACLLVAIAALTYAANEKRPARSGA